MDATGQGLRALFWVLVGIGCVFALGSAVSIGAVADVGPQGATLQEVSGTDRLDEADEIHIDVFVHENGSATFAVDYRFENDSDGQWEELRDDVESNPAAYESVQEEKWSETLSEGENATEREMELSNVSVGTDSSSAPRELGHVVVSFEWSDFAYVELNRIEIEGALAGVTLSGDTSFQVHAPEEYTIEEANPSPEGVDSDDGAESVYWVGDGDPFSSDPPRIVMMKENDASDEVAEADDDPDGGPSMPWVIVLAALALLATVGVAGWLVGRRRRDATDHGTTNGGTARQGSSAGSDVDDPPPELLSNEERVLQLLEERGGRIKQQEVVSELDWTEAKTSQVVSGLREDDEIDVFRIGRENVLALSENDDGGT